MQASSNRVYSEQYICSYKIPEPDIWYKIKGDLEG